MAALHHTSDGMDLQIHPNGSPKRDIEHWNSEWGCPQRQKRKSDGHGPSFCSYRYLCIEHLALAIDFCTTVDRNPMCTHIHRGWALR